MPPGNKRVPARVRGLDIATAGACIDAARRIQRSLTLAGDEAGAAVARLVANSIEEVLLKGAEQPEGSLYGSTKPG